MGWIVSPQIYINPDMPLFGNRVFAAVISLDEVIVE